VAGQGVSHGLRRDAVFPRPRRQCLRRQGEGIVPVEGGWVATTSVGLPVSFEVKEGNVLNAHFGFNKPQVFAVQNASTGHVSGRPSGIVLGKNGSFSFYDLKWRSF
jgi:hypothetical protein